MRNLMDDISLLEGYYMPAEFEPHEGCIMIWPVRPGSWPYGGRAAQKAFCEVACIIAESEQVYLLADRAHLEEARAAIEKAVTVKSKISGAEGETTEDVRNNITVLEIESDDAWTRDVGPTFVVNRQGDRIGINWTFNAWGGNVDGLYPHWDKDDKVASRFCKRLGEKEFDAHPFVLEGGSIHSDGEGTILTTEACLLSRGRNPDWSRTQIEEMLCAVLGAEKIVWLPCGIYNDETNEHVDNICAFTAPAEVVLAWTDDPEDPQYAMSRACLEALERQRDAKGRSFIVHKLPVPEKPVLIREEDLKGYEFEEGEDMREAGERLAASYVNFYIANGSVVVPQFGDENDKAAVKILGKLFPDRSIRPVMARDILLGGGNIHCITQQIPSKKVKRGK